jgi:hypothetical protein
VKTREFNVGDLVLLWSPCTESSGKLESKWEGPYVVMEKNKARGLPSHRPPRKEAGVLMECGQPSSFLYLSIFKSEGLISYK